MIPPGHFDLLTLRFLLFTYSSLPRSPDVSELAPSDLASSQYRLAQLVENQSGGEKKAFFSLLC